MIGAQIGPYLPKGGWQLNASMSQFATKDEYRGTDIRTDLESTDTEVIEGSTSLDLEASYGISQQLSVTADVPVTLNYHWSTVLAGTRYEDTARGINDVTISARYWLFNCARHTDQNIAVNFGVRTPTGNANAQWPFPNSLGQDTQERPVDTAAQMGSGAWGLVLTVDGFKQFSRFALFGTGSYLFSLKGQDNTLSLGAAINPNGPTAVAANVRYNSAPDSYLAHAGVAVPLHIPRLSGLSALFAGRIVGVPAHNLLSSTIGFRQPGYFVTAEPGLNYDTKWVTYSFSVPLRVAQYSGHSLGIARNSDFTHSLILATVSFNLGGKGAHAQEPDADTPTQPAATK
ncbi:MAG: hypothetical protein WA434_03355 [Candidatus Acidiferrales bacterium]